MEVTAQTTARPSPVTALQLLVATCHVLLAIALLGGSIWAGRLARGENQPYLVGVLALVFVPLGLLYLMAGWGIVRWKNWGRILGLILNGINLAVAVPGLARVESKGLISLLLSCLVLWWFSLPEVKLSFSGQVKG